MPICLLSKLAGCISQAMVATKLAPPDPKITCEQWYHSCSLHQTWAMLSLCTCRSQKRIVLFIALHFVCLWWPLLKVCKWKHKTLTHWSYTYVSLCIDERNHLYLYVTSCLLLLYNTVCLLFWFNWNKGVAFHSSVTEGFVGWHIFRLHIWLFKEVNILESYKVWVAFWISFVVYFFYSLFPVFLIDDVLGLTCMCFSLM